MVGLAEHQQPEAGGLTVHDLAVGCDGRRMFLAVPALGRRVEASAAHALNLRRHTPPLARLLTELGRAQSAQVTRFAWGAAAQLPYLPRLRSGRVVLSAAQWRLTGRDLPAVAVPERAAAMEQWRQRRRVPRWVFMVDEDRNLPLDLGRSTDRALLRDQLHRRGETILVEAPSPDELGWCDGRAHEIVTTVAATTPPWSRLPAPTRARVLDAEHGQAPGLSRTLLACLYGHRDRQDQVLADHLPELLKRLGQPRWWLLRYRDPDHHLRLRIALPTSVSFGDTAAIVSGWVDELRHAGLLSEVRYRTSYPEIGRWGDGLAWQAAEQVFHFDSTALLAQLRQPTRPPRPALATAHTVAIAAAFTGSTEAGMRWIIDHLPAAAPTAMPRPVFAEAVRLADPSENWAALRAADGGAGIVAACTSRDSALRAYRALFPSKHTIGIDADAVLASLLHANYVRGCGIDFDDEAACRYLARASALAFTARRGERTR
jgi:thiopeptide-type bacteriocin biosynthesis protein